MIKRPALNQTVGKEKERELKYYTKDNKTARIRAKP